MVVLDCLPSLSHLKLAIHWLSTLVTRKQVLCNSSLSPACSGQLCGIYWIHCSDVNEHHSVVIPAESKSMEADKIIAGRKQYALEVFSLPEIFKQNTGIYFLVSSSLSVLHSLSLSHPFHVGLGIV